MMPTSTTGSCMISRATLTSCTKTARANEKEVASLTFQFWQIHGLITRIQGKIYIQKIDNTLLYIGRNTLPIYLFHPILADNTAKT